MNKPLSHLFTWNDLLVKSILRPNFYLQTIIYMLFLTALFQINIAKCGVPQGTTLFPVLLNIYLNDINSLKLNSKIPSVFADDTVLINIGSSWNEVYQNIEVDLKSIHNWLSDNSLFLISINQLTPQFISNLNKSTYSTHCLNKLYHPYTI